MCEFRTVRSEVAGDVVVGGCENQREYEYRAVPVSKRPPDRDHVALRPPMKAPPPRSRRPCRTVTVLLLGMYTQCCRPELDEVVGRVCRDGEAGRRKAPRVLPYSGRSMSDATSVSAISTASAPRAIRSTVQTVSSRVDQGRRSEVGANHPRQRPVPVTQWLQVLGTQSGDPSDAVVVQRRHLRPSIVVDSCRATGSPVRGVRPH